MDVVIDRRILDQVRHLQKLGDRVFVAALGNQARLLELDGASTILISQHQSNVNHTKLTELMARLRGEPELQETVLFSKLNKSRRQIDLKLSHKAKQILKSVLPTWLKIMIFNMLFKHRKVHFFNNSTIPFWINSGVTLSEAIEIKNVDIFIGVDLPGAVAAFLTSKQHPESLFWFDAHEYYSQQSFLNDKMDLNMANEIELKLINQADIFTTVSESLRQHILIKSGRQGPSFTLNNSTPQVSLPDVPSNSIKLLFPGKKVLLFHGGLSDVRGITNLANSFIKANHPEWVLALIGYWPSAELQQLVKMHDSIHLFEPVSVDLMHKRIFGVDAIIIPYPGDSDINTKYCFPNKLGDAIALRTPIIYDSSLVEIDDINREFQLGIACALYGKSPTSLENALNEVSRLFVDWERVETEIGWTRNEAVISQILSQKKIWMN
jgi:hypothetical protein